MTAEAQTIPDDIRKAAYDLGAAIRHHIAVSEVELIQHDATVDDMIAMVILAERERNARPRKKIIEAMCELPHSIDEEKVEFRFDPRRPGHNALNQLITVLEGQFGASEEEA